jgi:murein DD-endopeptidase MepM/ murein hydrolase activator NlpD
MVCIHSLARSLTLPMFVVAVGGTWGCSGPTGPSPLAPGGAGPGSTYCVLFPGSQASAYVLPFGVGRRFRVSRTFGHDTPLNGGVGRFAVDIDMPIGTPVLAMRSGVVVAVEERFSDSDHAVYHENWVMVRHADHTVARYIHLAQNGALVDIGDVIVQGQIVGQSGNSGASNGPHLHFDVQSCGPNLPPGYNDQPCGMTVPLSFRNAEQQACGLEAGRTYEALPFAAELR